MLKTLRVTTPIKVLFVSVACTSMARSVMAADAADLDLESLMNENIVSASKYEQNERNVPAAVSVLTREDIQAFGWRTLGEALSSLPGIHLTYDRQYHYLGVRGLGVPGDFNTRVLLAIDGNRMNDVVYDGAQVGREFPLDMDLVDRIEYIMGSGGAVYGQNAMFAVVNIITRDGLQLDGAESLMLAAGPNGQQEVAWRWGKRLQNGTDLLVALGGMESEGEDIPLEFPGLGEGGGPLIGTARGLDGEEDRELFTKYSRGGWSVNFSFGHRRKDDPTGSYFSDPFAVGQYSKDRYLNTQVQYSHSYQNDIELLGRLFLGRQRYEGTSRYDGVEFRSHGISEWQGGEFRLVHRGVEDHILMVGVEGQRNSRADQDYIESVPGGLNIQIPWSGERAGIYAQDEWRIADNWLLTLGTRLDHTHTAGNKWSPRAALIWHSSARTTWKMITGRAWRAPNAYESLYDDGESLLSNPSLQAERSDNWEFLVDQQINGVLQVRASVYRWLLQDLVVLGTERESGMPQYQSGPQLEALGTEIALVANWNDGSRLWGSVSRQDLSYKDDSPVINSPEWLFKLAYQRTLPWWHMRFSFETQFDGARHSLQGKHLEHGWLAHASLGGPTGVAGLEWSLNVRNVFDHVQMWPAADTNWQDSLAQEGRIVRLRLNLRY